MFSPESLPVPENFYAAQIGRLPRPNRGRVMVRCPFHEDRRPSLSIDLRSPKGQFHCFGCQESGDMVDFLVKRDGLDFKRAAMSLGAWTEPSSESDRRELEKAERERQRIARAAELLLERERVLRFLARHSLHSLEKAKRRTSDRLRNCAADSSEAEAAWMDLESLETRIVELDATYRLLSFAPIEKRARFVLNGQARPKIIAEELFGRL
jgi:hypothetical protein